MPIAYTCGATAESHLYGFGLEQSYCCGDNSVAKQVMEPNASLQAMNRLGLDPKPTGDLCLCCVVVCRRIEQVEMKRLHHKSTTTLKQAPPSWLA